MGTEDHPIENLKVKIDDGRYHMIRFTRSGSNSTLQIDDHPVRIKNPKGMKSQFLWMKLPTYDVFIKLSGTRIRLYFEGQLLNVFNSQSKIQIGGKRNAIKGTIDRPFHGVVAGFVFNNKRILDMASEDDHRVKLSGDVELLMSIPYDSPQAFKSSADNRMMKVRKVGKNNVQSGRIDSFWSYLEFPRRRQAPARNYLLRVALLK